MTLKHLFTLLLIGIGAGSTPILNLARAQTQPHPNAADSRSARGPDISYRIDAALVNVDVMVTDDEGPAPHHHPHTRTADPVATTPYPHPRSAQPRSGM